MIYEIAMLFVVAILWGGTNPLIKQNTKEIVMVKSKSYIKQFLLELKYLICNPQYLIPMTLNQIGSILYFLTLQRVDLTLAVPIANSLTFMFTALSGRMLGEHPASRNTYLGMLLILSGTSLCCYDKYLLVKQEIPKQII